MDEVKPAACVPTVEHREPCVSHRKLLSSKNDGGERCGKAGARFRQA